MKGYKYSMKFSKKAMAFTYGCGGFPLLARCAFGCLPSVDELVPTTGKVLEVEGDAVNFLKKKPRGLLVISHGLSGGRFAYAHLAEALAAKGFIVAAPEHADSGSNTRRSIVTHGLDEMGESLVLRANDMDCTTRYLKKTLGVAKHAMLGYSYGAPTIRIMPDDCPRIYIGGPIDLSAPNIKDRGMARFDPDINVSATPPPGPSLLICSKTDSLTPPPAHAAQATGCPMPERKLVADDVDHKVDPSAAAPMASLPTQAILIFKELSHGGFKNPAVAYADGAATSKATCGLMKAPDPAMPEQSGAAAVILPLIVKFMESCFPA